MISYSVGSCLLRDHLFVTVHLPACCSTRIFIHRMILPCQTADETQDSLNHSIPFMSAVLNLRLVECL